MVEQHIREQIAQQMDYYVDAYKRHDYLNRQAIALTEQLSEIEHEMAQQAQFRDHAIEAVNKLIADYEEPEDVEVINEIVQEKMKEVIGVMVAV